MANVRLRWNGSVGRLGRRDLTKGDAYELLVIADGSQITGTATIPKAVAVDVKGVGAGAVARWRAASPGDVYMVQVSVDNPSKITTRDSSYTIKANAPREAWIVARLTVAAVDSNYLAYQADPLATTFGLSGARGVFVGVTRESAELDMGEAATVLGQPPSQRTSNPSCHRLHPLPARDRFARCLKVTGE